MALKWTKKQDQQEQRDIPTAEFKDFFADNVCKNRQPIPQNVKIEGKG